MVCTKMNLISHYTCYSFYYANSNFANLLSFNKSYQYCSNVTVVNVIINGLNSSTRSTLIDCKAMKSSPLLGPFVDSEFWGFSVENIDRLGAMMFQTSDNSQLCIDSQYSSQQLTIV